MSEMQHATDELPEQGILAFIDVADLARQHDVCRMRRKELSEMVKNIPIFANLYPPLEMDKDFINLSLCGEFGKPCGKGSFRAFKHFHEGLEMQERSRQTGTLSATELFHGFHKGVILGLPGAGKTTILRHFAHTCLAENKETPILLVNCRNISAEETLSFPLSDHEVFQFLVKAFLFPGKPKPLSGEEQKDVEAASQAFASAWDRKEAVVLIDALDESPSEKITKMVRDAAIFLMEKIEKGAQGCEANEKGEKENRVFLSSRPIEFPSIHQLREPVFYVKPIDMEDMRAMARNFFGEDSGMYKQFDGAIWRESWVKKLGGTPLTALLLIVYFDTRGEFNLRYYMYDILVKFVLNQTWEKLKGVECEKLHSYPGYALEEASGENFFANKPEIESQYKALSRLSFESLYETEGSTTERALSRKAILLYFQEWLEEEYRGKREWLVNTAPEGLEAKAEEWLNTLVKEYLFIPSGFERYFFIHSTAMEFLAASYLSTRLVKDKRTLKKTVAAMVETVERNGLETLPMLCGKDYTTAYQILSHLKPNFTDNPPFFLKGAEDGKKSFSTLPFRCLAETEASEASSLSLLKIKRQVKAERNRIARGKEAKKWVYMGIKNSMAKSSGQALEDVKKAFIPFIPLRRDTLVEEYLKIKAPGDVSRAQYEFLKVIVDEEIIGAFERRKPAEERPVEVRRDIETATPAPIPREYSPDDNNIAYYRNFTGDTLTGFYGSPNLRHSGTITGAVFSPDGKTILSASFDHTLKLWDTATGREIKALRGHTRPVTSAAFSPDGKAILSASEDKTLKLWNTATGNEIRTLAGHMSAVNSPAFSPDGKTILSASSDNTLKLWNTATGKEVRSLKGHTGFVASAAFSPDGNAILSASYDKTLKLWDADTGKEIRTLAGHQGTVYSAVFSPDGKAILSASFDKTVKLWDAETGKEIRTLSGHRYAVRSAVFSPNGNAILSASFDKTLKLWDADTGKETTDFAGHQNAVLSAVFSPDGRAILSASDNNVLRLWDTNTGKEIRAFSGHQDAVCSAIFSPDGSAILSASGDTTLKLWDTATEKEIRAFCGHQDSVRSSAFSPDGKTVLSASDDKMIKLWDTATGKEIRAFKGHQDSVRSAAFSPDGKTVLSASDDGTIKLWETDTGKETRTLKGHQDSVRSSAFAPGGKTVISASNDKTVKLWDVATGKETRTFWGHKGPVTLARFAPDGKTFLSASDDKTLKLWDAATGKEINALWGHNGTVTSAIFSPDGKAIISVSYDNTLKVWDVATGKETASINLLWTPLEVNVSPQNPSIIITANANGTVTAFDLSRIAAASRK